MVIEPAARISGVKTYYFSSKLQEVAALSAQGPVVINLGIGNPDMPPPEKVLNRLSSLVAQPDVHGYQPYRGLPLLREAFAAWYQRFYHVALDPDTEVLPLMGSKEGIFFVSLAFLNPGDRVLVPDVGYLAYKSITEMAGAVPVYYDLSEKTGWLPDFKRLEATDLSGVKLMWVNYPNMPTGTLPTATLYEDLVRFGRQNNILICQDNPYSFILGDHVRSILEVSGAKEVAIELNSLSKTYNMAGWRIGVLAGAADYVNNAFNIQSNIASGMYKPLQLAAVEALKQPPGWHETMNDIYRGRKDIIHKIMDFLGCTYEKEGAGLFVWARVPSDYDSYRFSDKLLYDTRVFVAPGAIFGKNGRDYIRVSLCQEETLLHEAFKRIKKQWKHGTES